MSQRFLKIKNFKNIGITKEEEQWERLYLNNSLDKDKIGELIILIGENNVGKSNILDSINIISLAAKSNGKKNTDKKAYADDWGILEDTINENFKNCLPDFMDYEECLPKLKLVYIDDEDNSYDLELNIDGDGNAELISNIVKDRKIIEPELNLDKVMLEFDDKFSTCFNTRVIQKYYSDLIDLQNTYSSIRDSDKDKYTKYKDFKRLYKNFEKHFNYFIEDYNSRVPAIQKIESNLKFINLDTIAYTKEKEAETYKDIIKEKYDIDFIPNIVFYKEEHIKDEELITTPEKIKDSKFFNSLFKAIGKGISTVSTAYEKAKINPGYKDQYQNTINEKLKEIVDKKFNDLYFQALGTQEYSFEIKLEKDEIYLSMRKNGSIITLAQQSAGFKWFFNFFFNFLYTDELKAGDIVLMDEPEIHLSIPGRRDLRKFIKKFAKDTGITFIATTHNPSFVDIDYFDEVRIIKNNKDGIGVKIQSNFSALADDEVDTLESIINSFGILRSDLIGKYKIIFVEGITDYNYLTAFKFLYNKEEDKKLNIAFIPIYGLGKDDNEMKNKLDKLIQFKDAILLTDGDTRGNAFKKLCADEKLKDKLAVIQLTEIDASFKNIENLFAQSDKEKFKDIIENKGIEKSSPFKNSIAQLELDEKTIENFNKVLDYLDGMS